MTEPCYVTEADLSIPLGGTDPTTGERRRIGRLYDISLNSISLPWPMTPAGARLYVLALSLGSLSALIIALWAGFTLIEPSLMRLAPAVGVALAIKFLVIPGLYAYGRRPGMDRREAEGES